MLTQALEYLKMGFSVIPCEKDKHPVIVGSHPDGTPKRLAWGKYQTEHADDTQIKKWWKKYPHANIAIVCGDISGVDVIDCDTEEAFQNFNENFLSDSSIIPTVKTPKGYHFYFKHRPGLKNSTKAIAGTDLKTKGGYVLAPPSIGINGNRYFWFSGLELKKTPLTEMPEFVFDILKEASSSISINSIVINNSLASTIGDCNKYAMSKIENDGLTTIDNIRQQLTTNLIPDGKRDELFFHLANALVKGSMPRDNIVYFLKMFLLNCTEQNPSDPFTEANINEKIKSAMDRKKNRDRNLTDEIRTMLLTTSGNISTTFIHNQQQLTTLDERKKCNMILLRLEKEGLIQKTGRFAGEYRILNQEIKEVDWINTCTENVKIWLPFELSNLSGRDCIVDIMPGDIILFAGVNNAGKSGVCMNIAKENRHEWKTHYISSELSPGKFKKRFLGDPEVTLDMLKDIKYYDATGGLNLQDFIRPGVGNLNIIDYLESLQEPYLMGSLLNEVFKKLKGGVGIVSIQKKPDSDTGYGGEYTRMRPSLVINLEEVKDKETKALLYNKALITKCKEPTDRFIEERGHPSYMKYHFNLIKGIKLVRKAGWHR